MKISILVDLFKAMSSKQKTIITYSIGFLIMSFGVYVIFMGVYGKELKSPAPQIVQSDTVAMQVLDDGTDTQ